MALSNDQLNLLDDNVNLGRIQNSSGNGMVDSRYMTALRDDLLRKTQEQATEKLINDARDAHKSLEERDLIEASEDVRRQMDLLKTHALARDMVGNPDRYDEGEAEEVLNTLSLGFSRSVKAADWLCQDKTSAKDRLSKWVDTMDKMREIAKNGGNAAEYLAGQYDDGTVKAWRDLGGSDMDTRYRYAEEMAKKADPEKYTEMAKKAVDKYLFNTNEPTSREVNAYLEYLRRQGRGRDAEELAEQMFRRDKSARDIVKYREGLKQIAASKNDHFYEIDADGIVNENRLVDAMNAEKELLALGDDSAISGPVGMGRLTLGRYIELSRSLDEWVRKNRMIEAYDAKISDAEQVNRAKAVLPFLSKEEAVIAVAALNDEDMTKFKGYFNQRTDRSNFLWSVCRSLRPSGGHGAWADFFMRGYQGAKGGAYRAYEWGRNMLDTVDNANTVLWTAVEHGSDAAARVRRSLDADSAKLAKDIAFDLQYQNTMEAWRPNEDDHWYEQAVKGMADSGFLQATAITAGAARVGSMWASRAKFQHAQALAGFLKGVEYGAEAVGAASMIGDQYENLILNGVDADRASVLSLVGGCVDWYIERMNIDSYLHLGLSPAKLRETGIRAVFKASAKMDPKLVGKTLATNARNIAQIALSESGEELLQGWNQAGVLRLAQGETFDAKSVLNAFLAKESVQEAAHQFIDAIPTCIGFGVMGAVSPFRSGFNASRVQFNESADEVAREYAMRNGLNADLDTDLIKARRFVMDNAARHARATAGMDSGQRAEYFAKMSGDESISPNEAAFYEQSSAYYRELVSFDGQEMADWVVGGEISEAVLKRSGIGLEHDAKGNISGVEIGGVSYDVVTHNGAFFAHDSREGKSGFVRGTFKEGDENAVATQVALRNKQTGEIVKLPSKIGLTVAADANELGVKKDGNGNILDMSLVATTATIPHELSHAFLFQLANSDVLTESQKSSLKPLLDGALNENFAQFVEALVNDATQNFTPSQEVVSVRNILNNLATAIRRVFGSTQGYLPAIVTNEGSGGFDMNAFRDPKYLASLEEQVKGDETLVGAYNLLKPYLDILSGVTDAEKIKANLNEATEALKSQAAEKRAALEARRATALAAYKAAEQASRTATGDDRAKAAKAFQAARQALRKVNNELGVVNNTRHSLITSFNGNEYTYAYLTSLPDMKLTQIDLSKFKNYNTDSERVKDAHESILNAGGEKVGDNYFIEMEGERVLVSNSGITHRGRKRNNENDILFPNLGNVLKNSVRVNEFNPDGSDHFVTDVFVYLGAMSYGTEVLPVRITVNHRGNSKYIDRLDVLKALNTKVGNSTSQGGKAPLATEPLVSLPAISIADLIRIAQPLHPDIFSKDVANVLGVQYRGHVNDARYSLVTDKETLDKLNNAEYITVYRAAIRDGNSVLSPKATRINGVLNRQEIGKWYKSDENLDLIKKGKFKLDGAGLGSDIMAAYAPYWHTRVVMANSQFSAAWKRPDITVFECRIPKFEFEGKPYQAEGSDKDVGLWDWSKSQHADENTPNAAKVYLSQYVQVVREVPVEEIADNIVSEVGNAEIPWNTVSAPLRKALRERGANVTDRIRGLSGSALEQAKAAQEAERSGDDGMRFSIGGNEYKVFRMANESEYGLIPAIFDKREDGTFLKNGETRPSRVLPVGEWFGLTESGSGIVSGMLIVGEPIDLWDPANAEYLKDAQIGGTEFEKKNRWYYPIKERRDLRGQDVKIYKNYGQAYASVEKDKVTPSGHQKRANTSYPSASEDIRALGEDDTRYSFKDEAKALILKKRPDLGVIADPRQATDLFNEYPRKNLTKDELSAKIDGIVSEIMKFPDSKTRKAALNWFINGAIRLPEDAPKVTQALEYAARAKGKANTDALSYSSPMAMIEALHEFKPKAKPINPDTVPELSDKREMGNGVVTYLVQDDRAGQQAMRKIINTHWGEDANPWCLLHGDGHGNLSDGSDGGYDAAHYWKHYSSLPKRVAFKDGKLLAFMATDQEAGDLDSPMFSANKITFDDLEKVGGVNVEMAKEKFNSLVDAGDYNRNDVGYFIQEYFEDEWAKAADMKGLYRVPEQWWDRKDASHDGIPLGNMPVPNDQFGRWADFEIRNGEMERVGGFSKGKSGENGFISWWDNGQVASSIDGNGYHTRYNEDGSMSYTEDAEKELQYYSDGSLMMYKAKDGSASLMFRQDGSIGGMIIRVNGREVETYIDKEGNYNRTCVDGIYIDAGEDSKYNSEVEALVEMESDAQRIYAENDQRKTVSSISDAAIATGDALDIADDTRYSISTEDMVAAKIRAYANSDEAKLNGWDDPSKVESVISETADLIRAIHGVVSGDPNYDEWAKKNPTVRVDWRDGVEKPVVTWSRGNVEYKYDYSSDLLCINNEGLETVLASPVMADLMIHTAGFASKNKALKKDGENGYTSSDYLTLYETLRDLGFVVPCKGCFDAAMRLKMLPSVAQKFVDLVNKIVDERNKDPEAFDAPLRAKARADQDKADAKVKGTNKKAEVKMTKNGLPTTAANKEEAIRIGVAGDNITTHMTWTQLMSAEGQTQALADWGGIFRAWQRTGAGRPKDKLMPEPWTGEMVSTTSTIIGKFGEKTPSFRELEVNTGTGLRRNSHSEFRPILAIDEIQFMREAYLRRLFVFKYMKELDDVRLFGKLGVKFNMSFFPAFDPNGTAAGLDADGNYIAAEESVGGREFPYIGADGNTHYDGMKGYEEATKYVNENVSLSSVVFSIPHLIKALTDVPTPNDKRGKWGSLIPFHNSGATEEQLYKQGLGHERAVDSDHSFFVEALTDYNKGVTNFEQVQNDRFGDGWVCLEGKSEGKDVTNQKIALPALGKHYYNKNTGVHLFSGFYILDSELNGRKITSAAQAKSELADIHHKFDVDYNDKVREIGSEYAYKDAADFYLDFLRSLGLRPRFDFTLTEAQFKDMCGKCRDDATGKPISPNHPKLGWKGKGHGWSPADADGYYALFCDYGMTDPETGKWSPHRPVGTKDGKFELPSNAVEIIRDGVDRYTERKSGEDAKFNDAVIEYCRREIAAGKMDADTVSDILSKHGIAWPMPADLNDTRASFAPLDADYEGHVPYLIAHSIFASNGKMPTDDAVRDMMKRAHIVGVDPDTMKYDAMEIAKEMAAALESVGTDPKVQEVVRSADLALRQRNAQIRAKATIQRFDALAARHAENIEKSYRRRVDAVTGMEYNQMLSYYGLDMDGILKAMPPLPRKESTKSEIEEQNGEDAEEKVELTDAERRVVDDIVKTIVSRGSKMAEEANADGAAREKEEARLTEEKMREDSGDGGEDGGVGDTTDDERRGIAFDAAIREGVRNAGVSVANPFAMIALIRNLTEDYITRNPDLVPDLDPKNVFGSRIALAMFASNIASFANSVAAGYAPSHARIRIAEACAKLDAKGLTTVRQVEQVGESIFENLNRDIIRQSRSELIKSLLKGDKKTGWVGIDALAKKHGVNMDENDRSISAFGGQYLKLLRRAVKMSAKQVEERSKELEDMINSFDEIEDKERFRDYENARLELDIVTAYGGLRNMMPAQIEEASALIRQFVTNDLDALQKRKEQFDEMRERLAVGMQDGIRGDPKLKGRDEDREVGLMYSLMGMMEVRASILTSRCRDEKARNEALAAFKQIEELMFHSATMERNFVIRARNDMRAMIKDVFGVLGESKFAKLLDTEIDEDTAAKLDRGDQHTKWRIGNVMQMYVSVVQSDYASNCDAYGRTEGYALMLLDIIEKADPRLIEVIDRMRAMYADYGRQISEVTMRVSGVPMLTPNDMYMPVAIKRPMRGKNGESRQFNAYAPALTPRVKHGLDFDQTADIMSVWADRIAQSGHSVGYLESAPMIQGTLQATRVLEQIRRAWGQKAATQWNDYVFTVLSGSKAKSTAADGIASDISRVTSRLFMWGNLSSNINQLAAVFTSALSRDVGIGGMAKNIGMWALKPAQMWRACVDLTSTRAFVARYGSDLNQAVVASQRSGKYGALQNSIDKFVDFGMAGLSLMDKVGVMALANVYYSERTALENGGMNPSEASERAAEKLMLLADKTAQGTTDMNASDLQTNGNAITRMFLQFKTAPLQQFQYEYAAWVDWKNDKSNMAKARRLLSAIVVNHILANIVPTAVSALMVCLVGKPDDEKEWENEVTKALGSTITGAYGSIPILGMMIDSVGSVVSDVIMGNKPNVELSIGTLPSDTAFKMVATVVKDLSKAGGEFIDACGNANADDILDGVKDMALALSEVTWAGRKAKRWRRSHETKSHKVKWK